MKDLIDYSRETGTGPMESLAKFPRRNSSSAGPRGQAQQHEDQLQQQQMLAHNSNGDQTPSSQPSAMQIASNNGIIGMVNINNSITSAPASTTTSTIVGLLHQNSMNSRQNSMNNASPGSSSTMPQAQPNLSPFQAPTPSSSNNPQQASRPSLTSANHMSAANSPANISMQQQPSLSGEADPGDAQSSVQKFIHEMLMSSQMNGSGGMVGVGSLGNDMKNVNGVLPMSTNTGLNSGNGLMGNGALSSNSGVGVGSYGTMNLGQSAITNGMRAAMGNNSVMNGRGGMASVARDQAMNHQQDLSNQLLSGLGSVNGFNNLQFDWKPSP
ncbi:PREDICTED: transcriptional corepressor SEUSS-like isoform X2 [Lupinus angustifolius]|nr:PREDICTED: transcriptional corepressor SEUSS-like isoform X2 [Lupinus angustifolius]